MSTTLTKSCFYIDLGKISAIDKLAPSMTKIHVSQLFMLYYGLFVRFVLLLMVSKEKTWGEGILQ